MSKPVIGVTGPESGGLAAWLFTRIALLLQGASAVHITSKKIDNIKNINGLIIGGGSDIHPENYSLDDELHEVKDAAKQSSEKGWLIWFVYPFIYILRRLLSTKKHSVYNKQRDKLELKLLELALDKQLPVLGICRGAQLINVHLQGTLHNDILEFYEESPLPRSVFPVKEITIEDDTLLERTLQKKQCTVNALHHQAIKDLGKNIRVSARETNNIIQAIELCDYPFLIGVQWHPEYLPFDKTQRRLFKSFVAIANNTNKAKFQF